MSQLIQILDQHAANQIAAGEVVERPVSVVKELVENSLDSGARHIDVVIEGSGVELIRVRDDGCGITPEDLPFAVLRHATSKIRSIQDLETLSTLGFRGEALPSIASVSLMEISSRPYGSSDGMQIKLKGGQNQEISAIGCPPGTTVLIQDLFYNTPARRKFLRSKNTEFGQISEMLGRLALARPDVAFSLAHPKQIVFQTSVHNDLREAIGAVFGLDLARKMLPISYTYEKWSCHGYIGPQDLVRSNKQGEVITVNGRIIRSSLLSRAIQAGYQTFIPAKYYPITVLHLQVPPSEYDVNVHPSKLDIRFYQEQKLAEFITDNIRNTLLNQAKIPTWSSTKIIGPKPEMPEIEASAINILKNPRPIANLTASVKNPEDFISHSAYPDPLETIDPDNTPAKPSALKDILPKLYPDFIAEAATNTPGIVHPTSLFNEINLGPRADLNQIRPLAQLFMTYILATNGNELILIDQHAAHERINYELFQEQAASLQNPSQNLLVALPIEFTLQEEQVVLEYLWILNEMGFVLEEFGARTYLLRAVPAYTASIEPEQLLHQFIAHVLQKNFVPTFDTMIEEWIYLAACRESIKARESLSLLEMEQLLSRLFQVENPFTCPHGRPTMIRFSRTELEKRFYRT